MDIFLENMGGIFITILVFAFAYFLFVVTGNLIFNYQRKQAIKNRFKNPPLAKCYCIDCQSYSVDDYVCNKLIGMRTAPNWFCWAANPKPKPKPKPHIQ